MCNMKSKQFSYSLLTKCIKSFGYGLPLSLMTSQVAIAEDVTTLDTVDVVDSVESITRFDKDISGLSKVVKSAESLRKLQIAGIRDMVKYDPGVSVVEQGRGGSSGYSIYGVDKNRVAILVDGVSQVQSYVDETTNSGNTGSMNEIEIANLQSVEISKGSNGAFIGSGALGGSVEFITKNASHIVPKDQNYVLKSQSGYTSKDGRFSQTVSAAMQNGKFSALLQYTLRKGGGVKAHTDLEKYQHSFTRLGGYEERFDLRSANKQADKFKFEGCNETSCEGYKLQSTKDAGQIALAGRDIASLSPEEKAQYDQMQHIKETVPAKDYTGKSRLLPNPMDYKSDSYLANLTFQPKEGSLFGLILEETRQQYDSRDMTYCHYLPLTASSKEYCDTSMAFLTHYNRSSSDIPSNASAFELSGIHLPNETFLPALKYTRIKMLREKHNKKRAGLSYETTHLPFFNKFKTSLNYQEITQKSLTEKKGCSLYPTVDENCQPTLDKVGSFSINEKAHYQEKTAQLQFNFEKYWELGQTAHSTKLFMGLGKTKANYHRTNHMMSVHHLASYLGRDNNGVEIYRDLGSAINITDSCYNKINCSRSPIFLKNSFIGLSNVMFWDKLSISGSMRFDKNQVSSDDKAIRNKEYKNHSFGVGMTYQFTDSFSLLAKASTGFRIPSFQETYGYDGIEGSDREGKHHYIPNLSTEKSLSYETGIRFNNGVWDIELSGFHSKYRDMIAQAALCKLNAPNCLGTNQDVGYFNAQNADLEGVNFRGQVNLYDIYNQLPEGLSAFGAYSKIRAKRLFLNEGNWHTVESYPLEAVQPGRFVYGLSYDNPNNIWGMTATWIYSKAKNPDELAFNRTSFGNTYDTETTKLTTKSWITLDLNGYYNINKYIVLRAGINNVFNYRYTTWESARQSSRKGMNVTGHKNLSPSRYAATGRNFVLGLDITF